LKLGIKLPYSDRKASAADLKGFVRHVEGLGFDSIWLGDHIVLPEQIDRTNYSYLWRFTQAQLAQLEMQNLFPEKYFLEAMTTCGYLAGVSDRMSIGVGVIVVPMRNPVELAAQLATLDVLSGGKIIAGIGTGWAREEFQALGRGDYYGPRGKVLDESVALMRTLWGPQPASFEGSYFSFPPVYCEPTPIQVGGPPIWVGGDSRRALRRVVELGDGWQPVELPPDRFAEASAQLDEMLCAVGRDPAEIERSVSTRLPLSDTSDGRAEHMVEDYLAAGCTHLVMYSGWRNTMEQNYERASAFHEIATRVLERQRKIVGSGAEA
jgi:probable F420-dependent oxidoreductase